MEKFTASGREKRMYHSLKDPKFNLYCFFLMSNIELFDNFNLLLQRDEPCVHILLTNAFNCSQIPL